MARLHHGLTSTANQAKQVVPFSLFYPRPVAEPTAHDSHIERPPVGGHNQLVLSDQSVRLTVVDEDIRAAARPVIGFDGCSPDVVRAGQIDWDEVGLVDRQVLLLENRKEVVEL